jgi:hypothetical protein
MEFYVIKWQDEYFVGFTRTGWDCVPIKMHWSKNVFDAILYTRGDLRKMFYLVVRSFALCELVPYEFIRDSLRGSKRENRSEAPKNFQKFS